ncbi:MAG: hypothetical protein OSA99_07175 [Acidimicrobiales bacterium]|nr:hypothetical protein [Acidimicrobiales bacterium]
MSITEQHNADDTVVTGPVPVLDLADGHLHVSTRRGVTLVEIDGGLDDDLARRLVPLLRSSAAEAAALILDLDQTTLLDQTALEAVCTVVSGLEVDRCVVAGRISGRLVLDRWGIPDRFVVFSSVADALQARAFLESGYGTGWSTGRDLHS